MSFGSRMKDKHSPRTRPARVAVSFLTLFALTLTLAHTGRAQKHENFCRCVFRTVTLVASVERGYSPRASKDALKWADEQLKAMTLEEKAGQLISVGMNARFLNQQSDEFKELRRQVEQNHVGGIILFRGPVYESVHLVNRMQQLARLPLLISADLESGSGMRFDDATNFPWNMAVGATGNPDYARREGELTAREARALGVQQIFAPVADVNNNAGNPV